MTLENSLLKFQKKEEQKRKEEKRKRIEGTENRREKKGKEKRKPYHMTIRKKTKQNKTQNTYIFNEGVIYVKCLPEYSTGMFIFKQMCKI